MRLKPLPAWRVAVVAACLVTGPMFLVPRSAPAQSVESDLTPESENLVKDASQYALPDFGDTTLEAAKVTDERDRFSIKFGFALLAGDYTSFEQDADSEAQVGIQEDEFEARSLRLMARGHFDLLRKFNYVFSYEYKGFANEKDDPDWAATDLSLSTEFEHVGKLTVGKIKESHAYEMVGDAANLPHPERLLSPFFVSRNVGAQLSNTMLDQQGTWSIGVFNDWWTDNESFGDSGTSFAGRVTALPLWADGGARYLHVAASVRFYGAEKNQLRFRGQPASHVADYYVDTGQIPGDHAWNTGLEALWNINGVSVLGEYITSTLSTRDPGSPNLDGYYITASWVLSGEHRPYDRKAGYARRVLPQGRWGAMELMARYGAVDLDDESVRGGSMDGWWLGANWWATRRWKASVTYGNVDLDRDGLNGNTTMVLSRIQWIY